jgi:hypothetical protein
MKKPIKEQRLDELERDFRPLSPLLSKRMCPRPVRPLRAERRAGVARYFQWVEADQLKKIAIEIRDLRAEFGQPNAEVDRFLHNCSLRGSNVRGEPKLAKAFLDEILRGLARFPTSPFRDNRISIRYFQLKAAQT